MRPARGVALYAHEISRRSNPPSRAPRERPVATLLSTSLRPMPPLLLHSDSGLARIVAYGVAALADATPSGTAGIPFHSVQPFNGALDRPSVHPSVRWQLFRRSTFRAIHLIRRGSCGLVVSKSTILTFRGCSPSHLSAPSPFACSSVKTSSLRL